jgi:hypothetical protein
VKYLTATLMAVLFLFGAGSASGSSGQAIYVINQSSIHTWKLRDAIPAFQQAVDQDFGPTWNAYGQLTLVDKAPAGSWSIVLTDTPSCWSCAGFHEMQAGQPYGEVGARTGVNWELVFSHELFEILADPYVDRASYLVRCGYSSCTSNAFYAVEVADPVEARWSSYQVRSPYGRSVVISDFVTPAWYGDQGGRSYDFNGLVHHHHQIMRGGYAYVSQDGTWGPIFQFK